MKTEDYQDLDVVLSVNGVPLTEHDAKAEGNGAKNAAFCYVEATSGSRFDVEATAYQHMAQDRRDCIRYVMLLDGRHITHMTTDIGKQKPNVPSIERLKGKLHTTSTGTAIQRFVFADLETNDGPIGDMKKQDFNQLGEVTVKCYWVRRAGEGKPTKKLREFDYSAPSIPEKCLKGRAISNRATLGKTEVWKAKPLRHSVVSYPYGPGCFATFTFKYRSHRDLQIEDIIPRSPSPVPLEERDPATFTREEAIELLNRRNSEREQLQQVKREKRERSIIVDGNKEDDGFQIIGSRLKHRRLSNGFGVEIVDLTED